MDDFSFVESKGLYDYNRKKRWLGPIPMGVLAKSLLFCPLSIIDTFIVVFAVALIIVISIVLAVKQLRFRLIIVTVVIFANILIVVSLCVPPWVIFILGIRQSKFRIERRLPGLRGFLIIQFCAVRFHMTTLSTVVTDSRIR